MILFGGREKQNKSEIAELYTIQLKFSGIDAIAYSISSLTAIYS